MKVYEIPYQLDKKERRYGQNNVAQDTRPYTLFNCVKRTDIGSSSSTDSSRSSTYNC